jgi:hypothetical protein
VGIVEGDDEVEIAPSAAIQRWVEPSTAFPAAAGAAQNSNHISGAITRLARSD